MLRLPLKDRSSAINMPKWKMRLLKLLIREFLFKALESSRTDLELMLRVPSEHLLDQWTTPMQGMMRNGKLTLPDQKRMSEHLQLFGTSMELTWNPLSLISLPLRLIRNQARKTLLNLIFEIEKERQTHIHWIQKEERNILKSQSYFQDLFKWSLKDNTGLLPAQRESTS